MGVRVEMITYRYAEGQTPLDEDDIHGLIPNIVTQKDLDTFEQENILMAREWLMNSSTLRKIDISEAFIIHLHKQMFRNVWKWAGKFRHSNKNIGVDYFNIPTQLRQLVKNAHYWIENQTYGTSDLAIIFHHRLVKIHPFSNGNGRHARLMADAICAKYGGQRLTWGSKNNNLKPEVTRKQYISALHQADKGNDIPLIEFAQS